jgi:ADP-ribosylglycohydrolase
MPALGQICTRVTADNLAAALEAVPAAPAAFLARPDQPGDTIQFAIHAGGDTERPRR